MATTTTTSSLTTTTTTTAKRRAPFGKRSPGSSPPSSASSSSWLPTPYWVGGYFYCGTVVEFTPQNHEVMGLILTFSAGAELCSVSSFVFLIPLLNMALLRGKWTQSLPHSSAGSLYNFKITKGSPVKEKHLNAGLEVHIVFIRLPKPGGRTWDLLVFIYFISHKQRLRPLTRLLCPHKYI